MNEPKRWLEDASGLTADERKALEAGLRGEAPGEDQLRKQARQAVWGALSAKLPAAAGGGAAAGAGAVKGSVAGVGTLASLVKPLVVGLALGAVTAGGVAVTRYSAGPAPSRPAPSASVTEPLSTAIGKSPKALHAPEAVNPQPELPGATDSSVPSAAPGAATAHGNDDLGRATPDSSVQNGGTATPGEASFPADPPDASARDLAESRRIARARSRLRSGDARAALAELEAVRADLPNGLLAQEREALTIEALRRLGERDSARQRAQSFLARYPGSPHRAVVEKALE